MMFYILAHRSSASQFGAACAPCKDASGRVMQFNIRADAEKQAREWNSKTSSPNVHYTVEEYEEQHASIRGH